MQRTPEVTGSGWRVAFMGGVSAPPSPSGDFLARSVDNCHR